MAPSRFGRRPAALKFFAARTRRRDMLGVVLLGVVVVLAAGVSSGLAATSSSQGLPGPVEREQALNSETGQRLAQRDDPGRREERLRSRSALRGASRAEMLDAGRRHFPDVFTRRLFDGKTPDPEVTVTEYRGDNGALVKDSEGHMRLLQSTLPLRARAANGRLAPVDLSLRESSETFTTANSNAGVQIFKDPARGIRLIDAGFSITAETVTAATRPLGENSDGRVFFDDANASDSDVGFVAVPQPMGVEVGWLLATDAAPESYTLKLDLPDGARVRRTQADDVISGDPPRTFEVVDQDGKPLGYITPPSTIDSDGVNVKSSMRVEGRDRLVVDVQHHGEDLRYPLFVDPEVLVYSDGAPGEWTNWSTYQTPATPGRVASDYNIDYYGWALHNVNYNPYGAYMSMPTNTFFNMGTGRGFEYHAPANTYVSQATFGNMGHAAIWPSGTYNIWWQGILNSARTAWLNLWSGYASTAGITHTFGSGASYENYANIGIGANAANYYQYLWSGSNKAVVTLDWALVYITDPIPPQITNPPADQGWSSTSSRTQSISGSDLGTGLYGFRLTGPGIDQTALSTLSPCHTTGANWQRFCPIGQTITKTFTYTPAEGNNTYTVTAVDAAGNTSSPQTTWSEKIGSGSV